jgi:hypothetical protein
MVKYEIPLDLSGLDLESLDTDEDFRREAERLLPAALEELGQAFGEAAWRRQAVAMATAMKGREATGEMREFIQKAGRTYRRFAPASDRLALEDLLVRKLREAKDQSGAHTKDEGGSTIPTH